MAKYSTRGTLSTMKPGPAYDFARAVDKHLTGGGDEVGEKEMDAAKAAGLFSGARSLYAGLAATAVVATAAVAFARRR